jgi:hypothetical protein
MRLFVSPCADPPGNAILKIGIAENRGVEDQVRIRTVQVV